jgi:stage V sporulation protein B
MTGYFTAANRIGTLAAVEVAEQLCSMALTLTLLRCWAGNDPVRACLCVILGSSLGSILTLLCLVFLRIREHAPTGKPISVRSRIMQTALPLALADDLKSGITTTENLMVPNRLALHSGISDPLAAFGMVSGMVFPVLMFPAAILFGLTELLIPELARCSAAGSKKRIHYLMRKGLRVALIYGLLFCGLLYLLSDWLCTKLYGNSDAAFQLRLYALLIPVLYCDLLTDALTKGLGQQKICVRYNIITSFLDVVFLYLLLPLYGMAGYYFSFLVTHLLNFILSLRRLLKITEEKIPISVPVLAAFSAVFSIWICSLTGSVSARGGCYPIVLGCSLFLLGILKKQDILWLKTLLRKKTSP